MQINDKDDVFGAAVSARLQTRSHDRARVECDFVAREGDKDVSYLRPDD